MYCISGDDVKLFCCGHRTEGSKIESSAMTLNLETVNGVHAQCVVDRRHPQKFAMTLKLESARTRPAFTGLSENVKLVHWSGMCDRPQRHYTSTSVFVRSHLKLCCKLFLRKDVTLNTIEWLDFLAMSFARCLVRNDPSLNSYLEKIRGSCRLFCGTYATGSTRHQSRQKTTSNLVVSVNFAH